MGSFADIVDIFARTAPWVTEATPSPPASLSKQRRGSSDTEHHSALSRFHRARARRARAVSDYLVSLCTGSHDKAAVDASGWFAFVVYYSSFLSYWARRQQRQQPFATARDAPERKRAGSLSAADSPSFLHHFSALYGVDVGKDRQQRRRSDKVAVAAAPTEARGCRESEVESFAATSFLCNEVDALRTALGTWIRQYPDPQEVLWRQPALVASLHTLAEDVAALQDYNHCPSSRGSSCRINGRHVASAPPTHHQGSGSVEEEAASASGPAADAGAAREVIACPLCVAAALDHLLAAEALWCLLELHNTLQSDGAAHRHGPSTRPRRRTRRAAAQAQAQRRQTCASHVMAMCRVGVLNGAWRVPARALHHWLRSAWHGAMFASPGHTDGPRDAFLLTLANLVVQDEATLHASAAALAPRKGSSLWERGEADVVATLRALRHLMVRGTDDVDGAHMFVRLTTETPFPWLQAPPLPWAGGTSLLTWVCHNGYLQAARQILHTLLAVQDRRRGGTHGTRQINAALTAPLNAALLLRDEDEDETKKVDFTRLLLLAGASAFAVHPHTMARLCESGADGGPCKQRQRQLLWEMLASPGLVLDPPVPTDAPSPATSSGTGGGGGQLRERLRCAATPSSAADRLARMALRLWVEKVRHLSSSFTTESRVPQERRAQVLVAQDRVLRTALASLACDAYHPVARLLLAAVLARRVLDGYAAATVDGGPREQHRLHMTTLSLYREVVDGFLAESGGAFADVVRSRLLLWEALAGHERATRQATSEEEEEVEAEATATAAGGLQQEGDALRSKSKWDAAQDELQRLFDVARAEAASVAERAAQNRQEQLLRGGHEREFGLNDDAARAPLIATAVQSSSTSSTPPPPPIFARVALDAPHGASVWVRVAPWIDLVATLQAARAAAAAPASSVKRATSAAAAIGAVGVVDTEVPLHAPVRRGDLVLFTGASTADPSSAQEGREAESANGWCGFQRFDAQRILSPGGLSGTTAITTASHDAQVRCVLTRDAEELLSPRDAATSSSSSSSTSSSTRSDEEDEEEGQGTLRRQLHTLRLRCVRAPRWVEPTHAGIATEAAERDIMNPLQWLEVRPRAAGRKDGGESTREPSLSNPVDITTVLCERPDLLRILRSRLSITADGCGAVPCWLTEMPSWHSTITPTAPPQEAARASDEGATRRGGNEEDDQHAHFLTERDTCLWRAPREPAGDVYRWGQLAFPPVARNADDTGRLLLLLRGEPAVTAAAAQSAASSEKLVGIFADDFGF